MLLAQILAIIIFLVMFVLIIIDRIPKHIISLSCAVLTMVLVFGLGMRSSQAALETLNISSIFQKSFWYTHEEVTSVGISWGTIFFLFGMMIMVEGMGRVGFFRWLCMRIAQAVKYKTVPILITFMIMSFILAMFIDSITVILFLAAVTIELSILLKFNPVPMIISEIFCANLGGSATMCGDPPNIIIGTAFGYSFGQFFLHTGLIAVLSMVFIVLYYYLISRKELHTTDGAAVDYSKIPAPKTAILSKRGFIESIVVFAIAVVLLVSHAATGLTVASIGMFVAVLTVISTVIRDGKDGFKEVFEGVDFKTLGFFIGLFVVVGGLEQTGILELIAKTIEHISGGNHYIMVAIIIWISAIASAFIDNIPFAATMVPVISTLSATAGIDLSTLAWALAMGTDIGGCGTPIGASANVVGIAAVHKAGHKLTWADYCKRSVPATVIVLVISTIVICLRYVR